MSGNSSTSRRTTSPMRSSRSRLGLVWKLHLLRRARHAMNVSRYLPICSSSPFSSWRAVDALAVDEGAVQRALVLDRELPVALHEHGVVAGDGDVVEEDLAVGRAADARALAGRLEALPRPAAAGADDERRALESRGRRGARRRRSPRARTSASSRPPPRPSRAAPRSASSSSPPPGSGSRTRCSRPRSCGRRRLAGEDLRQAVDIDLVEHAPPARLSAGARRAPRAGCRSCRAGCGAGS